MDRIGFLSCPSCDPVEPLVLYSSVVSNQMRRALFAIVVTICVGQAAVAGPRDEILRVAPPDAALLVVVQNAGDRYRDLTQSPFAQWLPGTSIGKKVFDSSELKQLRDAAGMILRELDTTPEAIIEDVVGDAVAFAFSPPPLGGKPKDERAVILVRPRKPETLRKLLDRVTALQTKSGELKSVAERQHAGATYYERQKSNGSSEFYCFRGDLLAFSTSEADVRAVIDRDKAAPPVAQKSPELVERLKRLNVADAAAVILINPRQLDAEVKARVAAAKPDEKRLLARFAEIWTALDGAAVYLTLDREVELGVSVRFHSDKLPADAARWLERIREDAKAEHLIPSDAIFGISGRFRAIELIDLVASLAPVEDGKPGVKEWINQSLGPVIGRDHLPAVLSALGPDWAVWAEPPAKDSFLPTAVAAIELSGTGDERAKAEKALVQAIDFGFLMARFAYNARHTDQIEIKEEKVGDIVIKSLVNDKGFPPGFRPSFAIVKGYLVVATAPEAIRRFNPPGVGASAKGYNRLAVFAGTRAREYLQQHGTKLAKFLADLGIAVDEKGTRETIETVAAALELLESAELISRPHSNGLQLALKIKPARPLKK
jgi:hypothetical protein